MSDHSDTFTAIAILVVALAVGFVCYVWGFNNGYLDATRDLTPHKFDYQGQP
jgi:hypothetical protein